MTSEDGEEKAATKAERQQARLERQAKRADKQTKTTTNTGPDKHMRLCFLETIEVKKTPEGFQVYLSSSEGRRSFTIPRTDAAAMLRDLEAAIPVMRALL